MHSISSSRSGERLAWTHILPACCILVFLTTGFVNNVTGLFLQAVSSSLKLPYGQLSLSITVQGVVGLFAVMLVPRLLFKTSPKLPMSLAVLLLAGAFIFLSFAGQVRHWIAASAVIAAANSFLGVFAVSLILSDCFEEGYSLALGICTAFSGLSGAVLNPLVHTVIARLGWRAAYRVNAAVVLLAGLFIVLITPWNRRAGNRDMQPDSDTGGAPEDGLSLREAAHLPRFYVLLAATLAVSAFYMINQHIVSVAASLGLSETAGVTATTIQMISIMVFRIFGNLMISRGRATPTCLAFFSAGALGMLLMPLCSSASAFYLDVFLYAVGASFLLTIVPVWVRTIFGVESYRRIYPFFYNVFMISMSAGASAAGMMFDATGGYGVVCAVICAAFILAGVCALLLRPSGNEK